MKRLLAIVFFGVFFGVLFIGASVIASAQDENKSREENSGEENKNQDKFTIPEGKLAKLSLQTQLSSKLNQVNDEVTAVLYENVLGDEGQQLIARGTEFLGRITQIQAAKRPQKEATMTIVFDTMRMSYGTEKVSVTIVSIDDYDHDDKLNSKNDEGKVGGGHSGARTARNAGIGGGIGGLGGIIASSAGAGIGGIAGGIGVGAAGGVLLTKGKDIRLSPGTILRIKFAHPVTLPAFENER